MNLIEQIKTWFANHHSVRKTLIQGLLAGLSAFLFVLINSWATIASSMPEYATYLTVIYAIVNGLYNWTKYRLKEQE